MRRLAPLSVVVLLGLIGCDDEAESPPAAPEEVAQLAAALRPVTPTPEAAFLGVMGLADDAVWFVGGSAGEAGGLVARFDGTRVAPEATPAGPLLWWVFGFDEAHLWACGEGGRILRRTSAGWVDEPTGLDEKAVLWGVWGASPTDLWAVGGSVRRGGPKGLVLRSTGDGVWTRFEDAALPAELNLYKVWGTAADDVHFVGEGGVTLHWSGSALSRADVGVRDLLFTTHGRRDGPILAVGGQRSALVFRFDAGGWIDESPEANGLNGVFVRPDGVALATGLRGSMLYRTAAGAWHGLPLDAGDVVAAATLHAVFVGGSTWAVGGDLGRLTDGVILTDHRPLPTWEP